MGILRWLTVAGRVNRAATAAERITSVVSIGAAPARALLSLHDCYALGKDVVTALEMGEPDVMELEDGSLVRVDDGDVWLLDGDNDPVGWWDPKAEAWRGV